LSCLTASWFSVAPGLTRGPAAVRSVAEEAGPRIKSGVTGCVSLAPTHFRHAELVSASMLRPSAGSGWLATARAAEWALKRVQGDDAGKRGGWVRAVPLACTVLLAAVWPGGPAAACIVARPQPSLAQIERESAVIVEGSLSYRYDGDAHLTGVISTARVAKGPFARSYAIAHRFLSTACQGPPQWDPPYLKTGNTISGRFYLFREADGVLTIAKFLPGKGQ